MKLRSCQGVLALIVALLQSVGPAHCAWSSDGDAGCGFALERPEPVAPASAGPQHACCAKPEKADSPPAQRTGDGGCDCPCMRPPSATAPTAILLGGPLVGRELPAEAAFSAIAPAALSRRVAIVPTNEHAPPGTPARLPSSRGPPAQA